MRRDKDAAAPNGSRRLGTEPAEIRRRLFEEVEQQVRQAREREKEMPIARGMQKPASIAYIGQESRAVTPSPRLRDVSRFHQPASPRRTTSSQPEAAYSAREACRFHRESPRDLSSSLHTLPSDRPAAGAATSLQKRRDMPPDTPGARGRARSMTPEYYNRYSRNTQGTSLPGACPGPCVQPPPSPSGQRRAAACDPRGTTLTASTQVQAACRFHYSAETPRATARVPHSAFAFSSTEAKPTAGLAGSLRGAGSALPPQRIKGLRAAVR